MTIMLAHNNSISGILSSLSGLTSLGVFSLLSNEISGSLPRSLASVTSVYTLLLGDNKLSGTLDKQLSQLDRLHYLDISSNFLSGSSSPEFARWKMLRLVSHCLSAAAHLLLRCAGSCRCSSTR